MNRRVYAAILPVLGLTVWAMAQTPGDPLIEGLRNVEVASVADAIEQLYGQKAYMSHDMRPLAKTKFAGPAVTVLLKKEEHTEGSKASQGMLDAIDSSPAGSVYVMVLENALDYAGMGGLMATAMKARGFTAAVIDGGVTTPRRSDAFSSPSSAAAWCPPPPSIISASPASTFRSPAPAPASILAISSWPTKTESPWCRKRAPPMCSRRPKNSTTPSTP